MIFVSVGTVSYPFKRLVDFIINFPTTEELVIQSGEYVPRALPKHTTLIPHLSYQETLRCYTQADQVVSAAGEASCLVMLEHCQHQPILFPRQKRYGEHVDDQQVELAKKMDEKKLMQVAYTRDDLFNLLSEPFKPNHYLPQDGSRNRLISYLDTLTNSIYEKQ